MSKLYHAARSLAKRGIPVFPVRPKRKEPATQNGVLDATVDLERIEAWWEAMPEANIGIATGRASNLLVLDVDRRDGRDGDAALAALEARHGALPPTVTVATGCGPSLVLSHRCLCGAEQHRQTRRGSRYSRRWWLRGRAAVPPPLWPNLCMDRGSGSRSGAAMVGEKAPAEDKRQRQAARLLVALAVAAHSSRTAQRCAS